MNKRKRRGQAPTGYQWQHGELILVPKEAEIIRLAFELFFKERRKVEVARILNHRGCRSRQGNLWTGVTINRLLTSTAAVGEHKIKSTGEIIKCMPIVTRETWNKVQALLAEQKHPSNRPSAKVVHALSGLVLCGACDRKMYPRNNQYLCETCRNKIPVEDLEGIFIDELEEFWRARTSFGRSATLKEAWPGMQPRERRNLAEALVEMFVVGDADIEIRYKFPEFLKEPAKDEQIKTPAESLPQEPKSITHGNETYIRLPKPGERYAHTGMSRSALNELILPTKRNDFRPPVRSSSLRKDGQTRGTRLIVLESLMRYLAEKESELGR